MPLRSIEDDSFGIWTSSSTRNSTLVPAGIIDTSVIIDMEQLSAERLPMRMAISAVTLAELAAGPNATDDVAERARRQDRLQRVEATFDPVPFGVGAARAHGRIYAAVRQSGREPRGRLADLMIAATAVAEGLPLFTRNAEDFAGLEQLIDVIPV